MITEKKRDWGNIENWESFYAEKTTAPNRYEIPFWLKSNLTVDEASAYCGIGRNKLRELTDDENCGFVLWVGTKRLIKRRLLDEFLEGMYSV